MKTESGLGAVTLFPLTVVGAISRLKERLQEDYEQTFPGLGEIIRLVLEEEEARAWELSSFPHLLLPDLVEARIGRLGLDPVTPCRDFGTAPLLAAAC